MSFGAIAAVYDRFNDLSVYQDWLSFTLNALDDHPVRVLDLASGTGYFSALLAPYVDEVIGVDIDPLMVKRAQESQQKKQTNLSFQQGDMTRLTFDDDTFDVVTVYLDSICFLADLSEVKQAFSEIYRVLKPGGLLLFDVWTPEQILSFDGFEHFDYDERAALLWHSEVEGELQVSHHLTVFEAQENELYVRKEVTLVERTYPFEDYLTALTEAGFAVEDIDVLMDYESMQEESEVAERWFFKVIK